LIVLDCGDRCGGLMLTGSGFCSLIQLGICSLSGGLKLIGASGFYGQTCALNLFVSMAVASF
jgi:hypothetical protein